MLPVVWATLTQWAAPLVGHHGRHERYPNDRVPGAEGLRLPDNVKVGRQGRADE